MNTHQQIGSDESGGIGGRAWVDSHQFMEMSPTIQLCYHGTKQFFPQETWRETKYPVQQISSQLDWTLAGAGPTPTGTQGPRTKENLEGKKEYHLMVLKKEFLRLSLKVRHDDACRNQIWVLYKEAERSCEQATTNNLARVISDDYRHLMRQKAKGSVRNKKTQSKP